MWSTGNGQLRSDKEEDGEVLTSSVEGNGGLNSGPPSDSFLHAGGSLIRKIAVEWEGISYCKAYTCGNFIRSIGLCGYIF